MSEKKYKIKITPKANDDLDEIYKYIFEELFNLDAADNLISKIEKSMMRLGNSRYPVALWRIMCLKIKGIEN